MFGKRKTEVLVVGAGPVGLNAALHLAEKGVDVLIVDEEWRTATHSYGLALHAGTLDLLQKSGLADNLIRQAVRIDTMALYADAVRTREIRLSNVEEPFPFIIAVPQSILEAALEERLRERGIKVLWNHRVSRINQEGDKVTATIDELGKVSSGYAVAKTEWAIEKTRRVQADFVLGADGHRSLVRKNLGIEYDLAGEPDYFAVFEFISDADISDELRLVLTDGTSNVLWPLPGKHFRWSFQLSDAEFSTASRTKSRLAVQIGDHAFPYLTEENMRALIQERAPWFRGSVDEIAWSLAIRFERALAGSFGRGRVWMAGDACHLTGPVGGQSLNIGIREAHDLAGRMPRCLRENASLELLEEYGLERLEEWRRMLGLGWALAGTPDTDAWIAERAPRLLPCLPASGDRLERLAAQLGLTLQPV